MSVDRLWVRRDGEPTWLAWLWIAWKGWERQERPLERDLSHFDAERVHGDTNAR